MDAVNLLGQYSFCPVLNFIQKYSVVGADQSESAVPEDQIVEIYPGDSQRLNSLLSLALEGLKIKPRLLYSNGQMLWVSACSTTGYSPTFTNPSSFPHLVQAQGALTFVWDGLYPKLGNFRRK